MQLDGHAGLSPLADPASPLPPTLCQPRASLIDHLPYPAVQRLPALPHQMLQGVHALAHATPRRRVFEDSEQSKARGGSGREEDGEVSGGKLDMRACADEVT
jgi:hypothetical protein